MLNSTSETSIHCILPRYVPLAWHPFVGIRRRLPPRDGLNSNHTNPHPLSTGHRFFRSAVERCHRTLADFFMPIFLGHRLVLVELMRSVQGSQPIGAGSGSGEPSAAGFVLYVRPCTRQGKAGILTANAQAWRLHGQKA